jgi:peptide/nickel transport system substrate-binding protein
MRPRALLAVACLALVSACADSSGANEAAGGAVIIAAPADPDALIPALSGTSSGQAVVQQLFDRLADPGDDLNTVGDKGFRPHLARSWSWSADSLSIAFNVDPRARWHDGQKVRAEDVRFTFQLYTDPLTAAPFAPLLANIDSVSVRDSLTAVFWFKKRSQEQFFDATYQMLIHPQHLLGTTPRDSLRMSAFALHPVGSGRFRFVSWEPKVALVIASDTTNYAGRAKLDRVIFAPTSDPAAGVNRMLARETDVLDNVRPEMMAQFAGRSDIRLQPYAALVYASLMFSLHDNGTTRAHPLFGDRALRRAIARALDRRTMVRAVLDSLAVVPIGPAPTAISPRDTTLAQLPYNAAEADRLLDSLGWARGADGMRARAGKPLAFSLLIPATVRTRVRYATLIQAALKERGITVNIESVEPPVYTERLGKRAFDATIHSAGTDPTLATVRQSWGGAAALTAGGSNRTGYASPVFDALVDSAMNASGAATGAYWVRAFREINEDAPAVWLYEPRQVIALQARLQPTRILPIGAYSGLAEWTIPSGQRLPRDRASK